MGHDKDNAKMDSPYSWVVCISCFIHYFLLFGCLKSSGVFFVGLLQAFDTTRSDAAIIYTALFASRSCISGVFGGIIVHRFGFRRPMLIGSTCAFLGIFSSYFVTEGKYLILTIGCMQGIGFGIIHSPLMTVMSHYFKRFLGRATGIAMAGSGVGSMVLSPFIEFLISFYGLRGTFLIMSAIILHMVAASLLILDPETEKRSEIKKEMQGIDNKAIETELVSFEKSLENSSEISVSKITTGSNSESIQVKKETLAESNDKYHQEDEVASTEPLPISEAHQISYFRKVAIVLNNRYGIGMIMMILCLYIAIAAFSLTIADFSVSSGHSLKASAYLMSISSVADIVARLMTGALLDFKFMNLGLSSAIVLFGYGSIFVLIGLIGDISFLSLAILSGLMGFMYGSMAVHMPVTATHYIGKQNLPIVWSISAMFSVIPLFSLAPLQTYMQATFGNYNEYYYLLGSVGMVSFIYWFILGFIEAMTSRKLKSQNDS